MGNRATVTFDEKPTKKSIGVYLHWNGGPESIVGFVQALDRYNVRDNNDSSYQLARFIQVVANFFGGTTSIGVDHLENLDCEGNNGLFTVSRVKGTTVIKNNAEGKIHGPFIIVDQVSAMKHPYHIKDGKNLTMSEQLDAVNLPIFKKD